jgi:hypothetical protein
MFIRRLAASACALCLIIPAAAGAQQADHILPQPVPNMHTQNQPDLKASTPSTTSVDKIGSLTAAQLAAAYGTDVPRATPVAKPASSASSDDSTNGWRIAAVVEAALLAVFALGCALALTGRLNPRRQASGLGV